MAVTLSTTITPNSQSINSNSTNVTVKVIAKWTGGSYNKNSKSGWCKIDGKKYEFSSSFNTGQSTSGSKTIYTKTLDIPHNDDGTKTLAVSASYTTGVSSGTITANASKTLTTIPRKSTLTVADGTLNAAQTLTVTQKSSSFTHTIVMTCGDYSETICTKSSTLSFSFTPLIDLASENTTGTTVSVTYTITTYNGSTSIGNNTYTVKYTIPSSLASPTLDLEYTDTTGYFDIYGKYIQGKSILNIVATAAGLYGATIKSYKTTIDGTTFTTAEATTNVLKSSGELTLVCVVTDTRGYTNTITETLTVLAYTAPKITALTAKRCDADGTRDNSGKYLQVVFSSSVTALEDKNSVKVTVQYKKTADTDFTSEDASDYANQYEILNGTFIFAADKNSTYDITLVVTDAFGSVDKSTIGASEKVWQSRLWRGLGVAFGKFAELEEYLDSGWKIFARKGMKFPAIPEETDLNEMKNSGSYPGGPAVTYKYANCPVEDDVMFTLEVSEAGDEDVGNESTFIQKFITCEAIPEVYMRTCAEGEWNDWIKQSDKYNPGDTVYINYWGAGVLTNGNAHIHVTVPLNKQISSKVTSFTSSDISVILRQNNAYIGGSDATTFISPDSCTLNLSSSGLHFRLEFSSSVGGTNNDAIAVVIRANVTFA